MDMQILMVVIEKILALLGFYTVWRILRFVWSQMLPTTKNVFVGKTTENKIEGVFTFLLGLVLILISNLIFIVTTTLILNFPQDVFKLKNRFLDTISAHTGSIFVNIIMFLIGWKILEFRDESDGKL